MLIRDKNVAAFDILTQLNMVFVAKHCPFTKQRYSSAMNNGAAKIF
jgi:hypothetical protein